MWTKFFGQYSLPEFAWIYLNVPEFTRRYLNLPEFTLIYLNLHEFTWIYLYLPELTMCQHPSPQLRLWHQQKAPKSFTTIFRLHFTPLAGWTHLKAQGEVKWVHTASSFSWCRHLNVDLPCQDFIKSWQGKSTFKWPRGRSLFAFLS